MDWRVIFVMTYRSLGIYLSSECYVNVEGQQDFDSVYILLGAFLGSLLMSKS